MDVRPAVQRRALLFSVFAGPLALLVALATLVVTVVTKPPATGDINAIITSYTRAEYFARNFLLVWLAGTPKNASQLEAINSATDTISLNPEPMTVTDINVIDVLKTPADPETEWAFTLAATTVPPGGTMSRNYYRVTFVENNGSYQAITLPRLTNREVTPIKVETVYGNPVDLRGVLGTNIANFTKAYLVPGDSGNLGRYASEKFVGGSIANSPYTSVQITGIAVAGDVDPIDAEPGTSLEIMVTVKASISTTTYTFMQLPLRVTQTSNGQWLVDSITEPVDFGEVSER
jgi:hypothetical protein